VISKEKNEFHLVNPSTHGYSGTVVVHNVELFRKSTLTDFMMGGYSIHLAAAIDFTSSNGALDSEDSLHFVSNDGFNTY
jgi:hypothetical protein